MSATRRDSAALARQRLLRAGREMAARRGLRALTVRAVARRAGANLGSFVYHFGTRDAFVAEVIEHWYAPFYEKLQLTVEREEAPLGRLRRLCLEVVGFLIDNREFIVHVLMDAAAGEAPARRFLQSLAGRHPRLLLEAIVDAQARRLLAPAPPLRLLFFLLGALAMPTLLASADRQQVLPRELGDALRELAVDRAAAEQRLDWALRGIAAGSEDPGGHT